MSGIFLTPLRAWDYSNKMLFVPKRRCLLVQNIIVSARVPKSTLNQLYTRGVDTSIFRAGTLTVYRDQLGAFNQAVSGTIKFMP